MAEHTYFPRSFGVRPDKIASAQGDAPVMRITVMDIGGDIVHLVLGIPDWEAFQAAVADHEKFVEEQVEAAKRAAARERITVADPLGGPPRRKH